ncbi:MAG: flagellar basal body L-ring protein FlgH [Planctomycetes bacterium]|nr:flagellar basal body L-ring protein FlgH [Planctomycetota bacterium]
MKKKTIPYSIICLMFIAFATNAMGESLWQKRITLNTNLYNDNRALRIGDIVTVMINESTAITGTEDSSADQSTSHDINIDASDFSRKLGALQDYLPNVSSQTQHSFSGEGNYDSSRSLQLEITAVVTEILSNGNLIIEGNREIDVNKEKYTIKVSGIIRPIDVSVDNIIQSSSIANASINLEGKGFLTNAAKRGWFYRLKEFLSPL